VHIYVRKNRQKMGYEKETPSIFPTCIDVHWVLVSIDLELKKIYFFDSLGDYIPSSTAKALVILLTRT
jgi:Ulp1 family protease